MSEYKEDLRTVTEDEIKKVENDVLSKAQEAEDKRKAEVADLLAKAEAKGKETAMREYEEEQRLKKLEEEKARLEAELKRSQEEAERRFSEFAKQAEERFEAIESRKKGISKNESPFAEPASAPSTVHVPNDAETKKEIEENSRRAFAERFGINALR